MSTTIERPDLAKLRQELAAFRRNCLWFVLLGMALIIVGFIALGSLVLASRATVTAIGALLLVAGMVEASGAFWCFRWNEVFWYLLSGVLSIVVGGILLWAPIDALLALLLACLLMAGGVFKINAAFIDWSEAWGWPLLSGFIDLVLGLLIWMEWPVSTLWVLGLFVGISLVFRGFNWIGLGVALRSRIERLGGLVRLWEHG
jgi:uncharacterized membrane protein HdeD (DUF308 family)